MLKRIGVAGWVLFGALAAPAASAAPLTYVIDPDHSFQKFQYRHLGFSSPEGRFDKTSGTITLYLEKHTGAADVTIDVNSIDTGVPKLDEHLKGKDFFDAARYPAITFKSGDFRFDGDRLTSVTGDLTVHGVTRRVTLDVVNFACHEHPLKKVPACGADATATIKRSDYGVSAYVPVVSDEITLRIEVEAHAPK